MKSKSKSSLVPVRLEVAPGLRAAIKAAAGLRGLSIAAWLRETAEREATRELRQAGVSKDYANAAK